jgi:hypothetical protein
MTAARSVVTLLGALSWSFGILGLASMSSVASLVLPVFSFIPLICFVRGFPHHFVSVWPLWLYL